MTAILLQAAGVYRASSSLLPGIAPSFVRGATANGDGTDSRLTISNVGCDTMIVIASQDNFGGAMTPNSNRGGTFTELASAFTSTDGVYTNRVRMWKLEGFTSNSSHLINVSNAVFGTIIVYGLNRNGGAGLSIDQQSTPLTHLSSPYASNSIVPTRSNSLAIGVLSMINYSGDGSTLGVNSPFGNLQGSADGSYWTCGAALATLTGNTSTNVTFTNTGASTNDATAFVMNLYG
jgi:hypothetical protein